MRPEKTNCQNLPMDNRKGRTHINQQDGPSTTSITSTDFCPKVYVTRGIDKMNQIVLPLVIIQHGTSLCLDCDSSFSFHVQFVQNLLVSTLFNRPSKLQQSVRKCRFAMINMRYDAKVAKPFEGDCCNSFFYRRVDLWISCQSGECRAECSGKGIEELGFGGEAVGYRERPKSCGVAVGNIRRP